MASRTQQAVAKRFGPIVKTIEGTFYPQGNSTTPMTRANGLLVTDGGVTSVTRTGTAGTYTVQLDDSYRKVIGHQATVRLATPADIKVIFGPFLNLASASDVSFTLVALAVATPTDIAANADNAISFVVNFSDSTVRP
jgi:hypothetical protein